jgi:hypothetical protein
MGLDFGFDLKGKTHVEILKVLFGDIRAVVLQQHDGTKKSRQVALIDRMGVLRTFATTFFSEDFLQDPKFREIEEKLREGRMIAETFQAAGYDVWRDNLYVEKVFPLIPEMQKAFDTIASSTARVMSHFMVRPKEFPWTTPTCVGTIIEIYDPGVAPPDVPEEKTKSSITEILIYKVLYCVELLGLRTAGVSLCQFEAGWRRK